MALYVLMHAGAHTYLFMHKNENDSPLERGGHQCSQLQQLRFQVRNCLLAKHWDQNIYIRLESSDGIVNSDEFSAVGEGTLYLHFVNHFRDAFHDV